MAEHCHYGHTSLNRKNTSELIYTHTHTHIHNTKHIHMISIIRIWHAHIHTYKKSTWSVLVGIMDWEVFYLSGLGSVLFKSLRIVHMRFNVAHSCRFTWHKPMWIGINGYSNICKAYAESAIRMNDPTVNICILRDKIDETDKKVKMRK